MLAGERGGALVEGERRRRARRVVGVVEPQDRRRGPRCRRGTASRSGRKPVSARSGSRAPPCRRTPRRARTRDRPAPAPPRGRPRAPGRAGRCPPWSPGSAAPRRPGRAPSRSGARPSRRSAARSSGRPDGARVEGDGLDRAGDGGADERRRLLARLAHAEVDQVGAGRQRAPARLLQAHERVRLEARQDRVQLAPREGLQHRVGALQRGDLHVLVALVRLRGVAGAEVDRVEAGRPELRHRRPGLLGRAHEVARGDERVHPRRRAPRARRPRSRRSAARRGRRRARASRASASAGERPGA